jgi:hypothetical protein
MVSHQQPPLRQDGAHVRPSVAAGQLALWLPGRGCRTLAQRLQSEVDSGDAVQARNSRRRARPLTTHRSDSESTEWCQSRLYRWCLWCASAGGSPLSSRRPKRRRRFLERPAARHPAPTPAEHTATGRPGRAPAARVISPRSVLHAGVVGALRSRTRILAPRSRCSRVPWDALSAWAAVQQRVAAAPIDRPTAEPHAHLPPSPAYAMGGKNRAKKLAGGQGATTTKKSSSGQFASQQRCGADERGGVRVHIARY